VCDAPINLAPLAVGAIYFLYAFVQGIIIVRLMDETCAPGLMLFLCLVGAPLVTGLLLLTGFSRFTKFLLNVGRKDKLC
jgi:uncharacterized membrane protein YqhA